MSLEFPFEYAQIEGLGRLFYPTVILKLKTTAGWRDFSFLVDTGADITTIPTHLLPVLGIDKDDLKKSKTLGVGGFSVVTFDFKMPLMIGKKELKVRASAVEVRGSSMPLLLGRKDIFENKFSLKIDSKRKVTALVAN